MTPARIQGQTPAWSTSHAMMTPRCPVSRWLLGLVAPAVGLDPDAAMTAHIIRRASDGAKFVLVDRLDATTGEITYTVGELIGVRDATKWSPARGVIHQPLGEFATEAAAREFMATASAPADCEPIPSTPTVRATSHTTNIPPASPGGAATDET
jgi:hypothetical protein